jgi:hypothetical protein
LRQNKVGIYVISGEPQITGNTIESNQENGIETTVFGDYRCDAVVHKNDKI